MRSPTIVRLTHRSCPSFATRRGCFFVSRTGRDFAQRHRSIKVWRIINATSARRNSLESESFFLPDSSSRRRRRKNDEGWKRRKIEENKIDTKWNICNKVLISIYTKYPFLFEFWWINRAKFCVLNLFQNTKLPSIFLFLSNVNKSRSNPTRRNFSRIEEERNKENEKIVTKKKTKQNKIHNR